MPHPSQNAVTSYPSASAGTTFDTRTVSQTPPAVHCDNNELSMNNLCSPTPEWATQASAARSRYEKNWAIVDLQAYIAALEQGLQVLSTPKEGINPQQSSITSYTGLLLDIQSTRLRLASALGERYQHIGTGPKTPDLDKQIQMLRECATHAPEDNFSQCELAAALSTRFGYTSVDLDASEARRLLSSLFARCSPPEPCYSRVLYELGCSALQSHTMTGSVTLLDDAISSLEQATVIGIGSQHHRYLLPTHLGYGLQMKHKYEPSTALLQRANELHRAALDILPINHWSQHIANSFRGSCLVLLYEQTGEASYLDEAIQCHTSALEDRYSQSPFHFRHVANVATTLRMRYQHFGKVDDLQEAIKALQSCSPHCYRPAIRARIINQQSMLLRERYEALGMQDDSEEGIRLVRECLQLRPPGMPLRYVALCNLGEHLYSRFQRTRDHADIYTAIIAYREMMDDVQSQGLSHPFILGGVCPLVHALVRYYRESGNFGMLEEASSLCETWLARVDQLSPTTDYCELLYETAEMEMSLYEIRGSVDDLDRVILHLRKALQFFPAGHRKRYRCVLGLSTAARKRFQKLHRLEDAVEAGHLLLDASSLLPLGHTDRASMHFENALLHLEENSPHHSVQTALKCFCDGLLDVHQSPQKRLANAQRVWNSLDEHDCLLDGEEVTPHQILMAYSHTLKLLPRVAYFGLDYTSRLRALLSSEDLVRKAAIHALNTGEYTIAVEFLEQGRAVFWLQHMKLRGVFAGIPADLAEQLRVKAAVIEHVAPLTKLSEQAQEQDVVIQLEVEAATKRKLGQDFEDLVRQVRTQPHCERFLLPDTFDLLSAGSANGPVIIFVADKNICHAVIIPRPGTVQLVQLPRLTLEDVRRLAVDVDTSTKHGRSLMRERACKLHGSAARRGSSTEQTLGVIWHKILAPVINTLCLKELPASSDLPRITFCPTGDFAHLPLHAASTFEGSGSRLRIRTTLSNLCLVSYTPTMGALLDVQRRSATVPVGCARTLLVSVSRPPQWNPLPCAVDEINQVQHYLQGRVPLEKLCDHKEKTAKPSSPPTVDSVLRMLPTATIMHLACHGCHHPDSPLESGFVMSDGMLTVRRLLELKLDQSFLAFLSACETAKGDMLQPDQALHLAATMLFAGFRSVIGTMWSMDDVDGPEVALTVYRELLRPEMEMLDAGSVPYALNVAVRKLQDRGLSASRWAPYVHFGG